MKRKSIEKSIIKSLEASGQNLNPHILDAAKEEMKNQKPLATTHNNTFRFAFFAVAVVILALVVSLPFVLDKTRNENGDTGNDGIKLQYTIAYADCISQSFSAIEEENSNIISLSNYGNLEAIIDSVQTLHEIDEQHGNMLFGIQSEYYNNDLCKKMREYNDVFFAEKEILFVVISLNQYEPRSLQNVELINGNLVVTVEKPRGETDAVYSQQETTHFFVIELDKQIGKCDITVNTVDVDDFFSKEYFEKIHFDSYGYVVVGDNIIDETNRIVRMQTQGMIEIELDTWYFTSGIPNNLISVKYSGVDADKVIFTCKTNSASLFDRNDGWKNEVTLCPDGTVCWWNSEYPDIAYVDVIVRKNGNIIGYALISIQKTEGLDYKARVTESAIFPIVNGKYQNITDSYVETLLEKAKKED